MSTDARGHGDTSPRGHGGAGAPRKGQAARTSAVRRLALALAVPLCLRAAVPAALAAQEVVGHQPEASPFHDILDKQGLSVFAGRFAGNSGPAGVGARPGLALGGRLQVRLGGPVDFWATFAETWSSRRVIDASDTVATVVGLKNLRLIVADVALALNLTGAKTWHGLAPYVGLGLGISVPRPRVLDPGGFQISTAFTLMPTIGTRWYIARSLALQLEARDYYFRYQYPLAYYNRPFTGHADHTPVLPVSQSDRAWAHNITLWLGVTYPFTF